MTRASLRLTVLALLPLLALALTACGQAAPVATEPTQAPVVAAPTSAPDPASDPTARIASALSAGVPAITDGARLVDYPAVATDPLVELRPGTNGWTCFADWPATPGNDPQCFDKTWMQWSDAFAANQPPNLSSPGIAYMLQGGSDASNTDPFAMEPAPGDDWVTSPSHIMLVVPGKLDPALFSTDHDSGGPYIMFAGTPYEHLMIPVVDLEM